MTTPAAASRPDYPDEVRLPTPPRVEERGGERWYWVAPAASLPPGTRAILDIEGREVGLFNVGGRYFAFRNRCPHLGGPLCGGKVLDLVISSEGPGDIRLEPTSPMLVCPWHGWEFDLSTGQSYCDPGRWQARRYRVTVERRRGRPRRTGHRTLQGGALQGGHRRRPRRGRRQGSPGRLRQLLTTGAPPIGPREATTGGPADAVVPVRSLTQTGKHLGGGAGG